MSKARQKFLEYTDLLKDKQGPPSGRRTYNGKGISFIVSTPLSYGIVLRVFNRMLLWKPEKRTDNYAMKFDQAGDIPSLERLTAVEGITLCCNHHGTENPQPVE